jgi:hypothetical protein
MLVAHGRAITVMVAIKFQYLGPGIALLSENLLKNGIRFYHFVFEPPSNEFKIRTNITLFSDLQIFSLCLEPHAFSHFETNDAMGFEKTYNHT